MHGNIDFMENFVTAILTAQFSISKNAHKHLNCQLVIYLFIY